MSTFLGILNEYPNVAVDYFKEGALNASVGAYFLSHCHSDHMHGLRSPAFENKLKLMENGKLYVSEITEQLLLNDKKYEYLKKYLIALPLSEPSCISVLDPISLKSVDITVCLLPAAHCPGSVMFLFEGENGTVLYTGDIRLSVNDLELMKNLHNDRGRIKEIKTLYLDTTFCRPEAFYIPSRSDSLEAAIFLIKPWIEKSKGHIVRILCSAQYGYEHFFIGLHKKLVTKVHVNIGKYRKFDTIPEIQEALTCDPLETQIHACSGRSANELIESEESDCEDKPEKFTDWSKEINCGYKSEGINKLNILTLKLSAMWYAQYVTINEIVKKCGSEHFFRVCYSTHASLGELRSIVNYLQPSSIRANVVPKSSNAEEIISWLRKPIEKVSHLTDIDSMEVLPLLGELKENHLKVPEELLSQTSVNSSHDSKSIVESELDLSEVESIAASSAWESSPVKTKSSQSPVWSFSTRTPEKQVLSQEMIIETKPHSPIINDNHSIKDKEIIGVPIQNESKDIGCEKIELNEVNGLNSNINGTISSEEDKMEELNKTKPLGSIEKIQNSKPIENEKNDIKCLETVSNQSIEKEEITFVSNDSKLSLEFGNEVSETNCRNISNSPIQEVPYHDKPLVTSGLDDGIPETFSSSANSTTERIDPEAGKPASSSGTNNISKIQECEVFEIRDDDTSDTSSNSSGENEAFPFRKKRSWSAGDSNEVECLNISPKKSRTAEIANLSASTPVVFVTKVRPEDVFEKVNSPQLSRDIFSDDDSIIECSSTDSSDSSISSDDSSFNRTYGLNYATNSKSKDLNRNNIEVIDLEDNDSQPAQTIVKLPATSLQLSESDSDSSTPEKIFLPRESGNGHLSIREEGEITDPDETPDKIVPINRLNGQAGVSKKLFNDDVEIITIDDDD